MGKKKTAPVVAKSRAQEAREYRERKKKEMGEKAWKAAQAKARKERRQKAKAKQAADLAKWQKPYKQDLQKVIDLLKKEVERPQKSLPEVRVLLKEKLDIQKIRGQEDCDQLLELVVKAKQKYAKEAGKTITRKTIESQMRKVLNIYKFMFGKESNCTDFEWTRKTKDVIKFINNRKQWSTLTSKNAQFAALASILIALDGYTREYKIYSEISSKGSVKIKEAGEDVLLTEKEKKNILPWLELKALWMKKSVKNLERRAIIAITTLLPPRRNQDYRLLTITNNRNGMRKDLNYVLLNKSGTPKKLIYNVFKTAKTFGTQEFDIPPSLAKILKDYIEDYEIETNEPLFYTKKGDKVGYHKNFTVLIMSAFRHHTGKDITINLLRHAKITDFLSKKRTPKEKKELALMMAHSVAQQELYQRFDLK